MNERDIFEAIDNLIPFFIFGIWIFFTILGKNRKRPGSVPGAGKSVRHGNAEPSSGTRGEAGPMREFGRTIRTIFEEMGIPFEQPDILTKQERGFTLPESTAEGYARSMEDSTVEAESTLESAADLRSDPRKTGEKKRKESMEGEGPRTYDTARITRETVRAGIVWSEILMPPVSMRADTHMNY